MKHATGRFALMQRFLMNTRAAATILSIGMWMFSSRK
jgi:hypothetical protein